MESYQTYQSYQSPFFDVDPARTLSDYPCGIASPPYSVSPVSPVTPPISSMYNVMGSAPKTPTFLFPPCPETPKLPTLDLLPRPTPTMDRSRPRTPTLQRDDCRPRTPSQRPLTPSAKAYQQMIPPQSRTTEVFSSEQSCSELACEEDEERSRTYTSCSHTQSSMPFLFYANRMAELDRDTAILQKGYELMEQIRLCPQGSVWSAKVTKHGMAAPMGSIVAIKRVSKLLRHGQECMSDEDGLRELVEEDIVKEAAILKHITVDIRASSGRFILKYVDFFETQSEYCLVTEWHENAVTIKQFVDQAHLYLTKGLLQRKGYCKTIKYLFWQLLATMRWLHEALGCCHLKLDTENVWLTDADFELQSDGTYKISGQILIKLSDFSLAEIFDRADDDTEASFSCFKDGPSSPYVCPEMVEGATYDARKADMFALGHILFYSLVGWNLYDPHEMWDHPRGGYAALQNNALKEYLASIASLKPYFKIHSFDVLRCLLTYDEEERPDAAQVMNCEWFRFYYERYAKKLIKKIESDRQRSVFCLTASPSSSMSLYSL